jgi:hypothetical protein
MPDLTLNPPIPNASLAALDRHFDASVATGGALTCAALTCSAKVSVPAR